MLPNVLEAITISDLQKLVDDEVREGTTLEYKRDLHQLDAPDANFRTKEHEEFLKDVSCFANSIGGDLLIGIDAKDGVATNVCGIQCADADKLSLRLSDVIRSGLQPKISAFIHFVRLSADRGVFVIRVAQSLLAPHRVCYQGEQGQFWGRTSGGAFRMDTTQLRRAFTMSETIFDRIKIYRDDRVRLIHTGETPVPMEIGAKMILHLIPVESFATRFSRTPKELKAAPATYPPLNQCGRHARTNMDGLLSTDSGLRDKTRGYVQLYRNGIIEAVAHDATYTIDSGPPLFRSHYQVVFRERLPEYLATQMALGISQPIWLMLTLTGMKGVTIRPPREYDMFEQKPPIDRDILALPEVEITDTSADPLT